MQMQMQMQILLQMLMQMQMLILMQMQVDGTRSLTAVPSLQSLSQCCASHRAVHSPKAEIT